MFFRDFSGLSRQGRTINSNSSTDFFNDLGRLLQGTASLLRTIVETKQETVGPLVSSAIAAKSALVSSPIVKSAVQAKVGVVRSLAEATPEITKGLASVVNTVAEAAPSLLKAGLCNIVCPITGEDQCKKDHCQDEKEEQEVVQPRRASKNLDYLEAEVVAVEDEAVLNYDPLLE